MSHGFSTSDSAASAEPFYSAVRENVVLLLCFLGLQVFAYAFLQTPFWGQRFWSSSRTEEGGRQHLQDLSSVGPTILILCSAAVAMGIAGLTLLPVTISSNEIIVRYSTNYYVHWLDESLLFSWWNWTFIGCSISLYVLIPFAYFYHEAEDPSTIIFGNRSRIRETLIVMLLVGTLIFAFTYLTRKLLGWDDVSAFVVLSVFSSGTCALLCLRVFPWGMTAIFQWIISLALLPNHKQRLTDELMQVEFEGEAFKSRLSKMEATVKDKDLLRKRQSSRSGDAALLESAELHREMHKLRRRKKEIEAELSYSVIGHNVLFLVLLAAKAFVWVFFIIQLAYTSVKGIVQVLLNSTGFNMDVGQTADYYARRVIQNERFQLVLGRTSSLLGFFGVLLELTLVIYFTFACLIGFHIFWTRTAGKKTLGGFTEIQDSSNAAWSPVQVFIGRIALFLVLSSSMPVIVRLLGLTGFELVGLYGIYGFLKEYLAFTIFYKLAMLGTLANELLSYFYDSNFQHEELRNYYRTNRTHTE
jgi:hypothetical protein